MKKTLLLICIIFLSGIILFSEPLTIRVATDEFPGGYAHEDGTGAYLDLLAEIYPSDKFNLEFSFVPYARAVSMTQANNADMYVSAYYEDAENVLFPPKSLNYGSDAIAVVYDSNNISFENESCLRDKRVSWIRGYGFEHYIEVPMVFSELSNRETGINMLRANRIDFFIDAYDDLIEEPEMLEGLELAMLKDLGLYYAFADTDFGRQLMDIYIQKFPEIKNSGLLKEIYEKYDLDYPF